MNRLSKACKNFGLTISLKKTQVTGQNVDSPLNIKICNQQIDVVNEFTFLGSAITDTLSLVQELNKRIGKATTTLSRLTKT